MSQNTQADSDRDEAIQRMHETLNKVCDWLTNNPRGAITIQACHRKTEYVTSAYMAILHSPDGGWGLESTWNHGPIGLVECIDFVLSDGRATPGRLAAMPFHSPYTFGMTAEELIDKVDAGLIA